MSIRKANVQDSAEIQSLILRSVEPERNSDFDEEGAKRFNQPNQLPAIRRRILDNNYLTLCFVKGERIAGIITMHEYEKLDQLFVAPSYRNKHVSKQLWEVAKGICLKKGNKNGFWVKSSTMAIPVYESFGFRLNGDRQQKSGMIYYPMVLKP